MSLKSVATTYAGIAHGINRLTARSDATPGREAASAPVRPSVSDELDAKEKGWFYYSTILGR